MDSSSPKLLILKSALKEWVEFWMRKGEANTEDEDEACDVLGRSMDEASVVEEEW